jgi:HK97 family phage major capsid protein
MTITTTTGGSILTPEEVNELVVRPFIEQSVCSQISTVVPLGAHSLRVPIATADPTSAWVAEGAEIGVSDPTLAEINVTPSKLAVLTGVTNELIADSELAGQRIGEAVVRDLRRKADVAYFANLTTNGPSGLLSVASTPVDAGDAWANLDAFEAAKSAAEALDCILTAWVCNPATALKLAQLKELTGSNKALLGSDPAAPTGRVISGIPVYTSPSIANDVVWGVPAAHSLVVIRSDATVVTDSSVYFSSDRTAIRATLRVGFGFTYPAAVIKITTSP